MELPPLTRDQCRELDRRATAEFGIPSIVLMENAGRGCVDVLEELVIDGPVAVLCGKGNNAGDGFAIARHLQIRGYECRVLLLCPSHEFQGDAAINFKIIQSLGTPIIDLTEQRAGSSPTPTDLHAQLDQQLQGIAWLIDAMLGTGAIGEPRPPYDSAIDWMNSQTCKKLAVDVPSGLDCDTGRPAVHTVRADHTCTFAAMKTGFTKPSATDFTGTIHVCDIGVPRRLFAAALTPNGTA